MASMGAVILGELDRVTTSGFLVAGFFLAVSEGGDMFAASRSSSGWRSWRCSPALRSSESPS